MTPDKIIKNEKLGTIKISSINKDQNNKILSENEGNNSPINNNNKNKKEKKRKKETNFFLYDTQKKKKNKKNDKKTFFFSKYNNIQLIRVNNKNKKLNFYEKLHNDILIYNNNIEKILSLNQKIKEFCIEQIKNMINNNYQNENFKYELDIYGSFATNLMIETSDIDIKIKINLNKKEEIEKYFFNLAQNLEDSKKIEIINPIFTASVPVIKLVIDPKLFIEGNKELENILNNYYNSNEFKKYKFDKEDLTKIKIDLTFILDNLENKKILNNNISNVDYVKEKINKNIEIKLILLIIKRYFKYKKMNNSFVGGISSYNLFLLILSYVNYTKIKIGIKNDETNLGKFFYDFCDFFKIFDFKRYIIDVNTPFQYLSNSKINILNNSLVIIDPLSGLNASKSSYKIDEIQNIFLEASEFLHRQNIEYDKNLHIIQINSDCNNNINNNHNNKDLIFDDDNNLIYKLNGVK